MARLFWDFPLYLGVGALAACALGIGLGALLALALWLTAR